MRIDQVVFFTRPDSKILSQSHTSSQYFCFTFVLLFPLSEQQNYPVNNSLCGISSLSEEIFLQSFRKLGLWLLP